MNQEIKDQITAKMKEWIDPNNPQRSQAALAQKSGVNTTVISLVKQGKYVNNGYPIHDNNYNKLAIALGLVFTDVVVHWDSDNFTRILQVAEDARIHKKVVVFDSSESGVGKTYALEYLKTYSIQTSYTKITKSMSPKDVVSDVAYQIVGEHLKKTPLSTRALLNAIRDRVQKEIGVYQIAFDETEYARANTLDAIKEIIDFTEKFGSVLICGLGIMDKIDKLANRKKFGFIQLQRRVRSTVVNLAPLLDKERVKCLEKYNIQDPTAIQWFAKKVQDFHMMSEYVEVIVRFVNKHPKTVVNEAFLNNLFKPY